VDLKQAPGMTLPVIAEDEAFARALAAERLHNARRLAWFRLLGVSGFFVLTVVAGWMVDPTWSRSIGLFAVYWLVALGLLWLSRRHGVSILVSEETRRGGGISFASVGSTQVKGRAQPVAGWVPAANGGAAPERPR
jgi:hypothetical protein